MIILESYEYAALVQQYKDRLFDENAHETLQKWVREGEIVLLASLGTNRQSQALELYLQGLTELSTALGKKK